MGVSTFVVGARFFLTTALELGQQRVTDLSAKTAGRLILPVEYQQRMLQKLAYSRIILSSNPNLASKSLWL